MSSLNAVTMGESMIAFEALDYGPFREAELFHKWVGGAEDNFAIGLARLGFKCGWFSRLGDDEFGKEIFRTIKGEGVDVSKVIFDSDAQTGIFFVERSSHSDFKCYFYRQTSAATRISPDDIDADYIKQAKIVYLTGITPVISDSARKATEKVFHVDLICIAVGLSPEADLCRMAGCQFEYLGELGGHVPIHSERMETSVPGLYVAGDIAGAEEASTAMEEGRLAGLAAAEALGYISGSEFGEKAGVIRQRLSSLRMGAFGDARRKAKDGLVRLWSDRRG